MPCSCGFTNNLDNTCDGTHKKVKIVKDSVIKNLEKFFEQHPEIFGEELKSNLIKIVRESK